MPGFKDRRNNDLLIEDFEEMTVNAVEVQKHVLKSILDQNAETHYLQNCGLNGRSDPLSFKQCVPIITHADIQPSIQRILDGDSSPLLTAKPIHTVSLSSGTTNSSRKYLLFYQEMLEATLYVGRLGAAYRERAFPLRKGGRILDFIFCAPTFTTRGGLLAGTATTHIFKSKEFKLKQESTQAHICSPDEVIFAKDFYQSTYCHLLCGLLQCENVQLVSSTFAYGLIEVFRVFEVVWRELCHDIRHGQLSSVITDASLRRALSKLLRPSPELANKIAKICNGLNDFHGLIPALWPNCRYVYSILTGSMQHYVKRLQHYAGDLPLVSADYGATESWIGVNINPTSSPLDVSFTIVPTFAYFEFIPLHRRSKQKNHRLSPASTAAYEELSPVGLEEVKIGQEYEVVMTTYGGLYRYRLSDVVKVTGIFNSSPQFAFVCRRNAVLNIHIDKNTEDDLLVAVKKASSWLATKDSEVELVDFSSYADLSTTPGHYVIFWELRHFTHMDEELLRSCASIMDSAFVDPGYSGSRVKGSIGPLELCIVKPGTFRRLLDAYLARNSTAITQYKTPRCLPSVESFLALYAHKWRSYFCSHFT